MAILDAAIPDVRIVESEIKNVKLVPKGTTPDYNRNNPMSRLLAAVEDVRLVAERERYLADSLQYLMPIGSIALYGPSGDDADITDPRQQENKNDFQKQNVADFTLTGTEIVRGYANAGEWTGAFLHLSFVPSAKSPLAGPDGMYRQGMIRLRLKIANLAEETFEVPFNTETERYQLELWGCSLEQLRQSAYGKAARAIEKGILQASPALIQGRLADFQGPEFDQLRDQKKAVGESVEMLHHVPKHLVHPLRPLHLEVTWQHADGSVTDPAQGSHRYTFNMSFRGWRHFKGVGQSSNPHGGLGTLEFRNLFTNYFGFEDQRKQVFGPQALTELGRGLQPWNVDADGSKPTAKARENFLAVDYMDLHILRPNCIIGMHRHRDNQEIFLLLTGKAWMVTGDWGEHEGRERALEVRTMHPGDLVLIKGGQFHALANALDENTTLFMFGGYD